MTTYEAFEHRLNELLDARRDPSDDPEIIRAAEQSPDCRRLLAAYQAMLRDVSVSQPTPVRAKWVETLVEAALIEAAREETAAPVVVEESRRARWSMAGAAAAAIAIAAGLLLVVTLSPRQEQVPVAQPNSEMVDDATDAQVATANTGTDEVDNPAIPDAGIELPAAGVESAVGDLVALATGMTIVGAVQSEGARPPLNVEWVDRMTSGMRPVTQSTTDFLDTMLEAFDVEQDGRS